jgi:hypothetical protein
LTWRPFSYTTKEPSVTLVISIVYSAKNMKNFTANHAPIDSNCRLFSQDAEYVTEFVNKGQKCQKRLNGDIVTESALLTGRKGNGQVLDIDI